MATSRQEYCCRDSLNGACAEATWAWRAMMSGQTTQVLEVAEQTSDTRARLPLTSFRGDNRDDVSWMYFINNDTFCGVIETYSWQKEQSRLWHSSRITSTKQTKKNPHTHQKVNSKKKETSTIPPPSSPNQNICQMKKSHKFVSLSTNSISSQCWHFFFFGGGG